MGDNRKNEKTEKKEQHEKDAGGKTGTDFHAGEEWKSTDSKRMFAYLTKPAKSDSQHEGAAKESHEAGALKESSKDARPYSEKNPPLDPEKTSQRVVDMISYYEQSGHGKVYTDVQWAKRHQGEVLLGNYIFCEEGNDVNAMAKYPIRSGTELDLYKKICDYASGHDVTDPKQKISPEMIMNWSLQVNTHDHKVLVQDAFLTAHNVMRALSRAEVANPKNLPEGDPIRYIIEDSQKQHIPGRADGLPQLMRDKYHLKSPNAETNRDLFDANNPYSVFKPMTGYADSSTGSAYHFWVGALGASTLSSEATNASIEVEARFQKNNDRNGQDERPWGKAGVHVFDKVQPDLHWWRWI